MFAIDLLMVENSWMSFIYLFVQWFNVFILYSGSHASRQFCYFYLKRFDLFNINLLWIECTKRIKRTEKKLNQWASIVDKSIKSKLDIKDILIDRPSKENEREVNKKKLIEIQTNLSISQGKLLHHGPFSLGYRKKRHFCAIAFQLPLINAMFSIENTLILAAVCSKKSNYLMEIFHISDCFALNANGEGGRQTLIGL